MTYHYYFMIGSIIGIFIAMLTYMIMTGAFTSRDWEQICRGQAEQYNVSYVDNKGSGQCWVRQQSGDLIDLWIP